MDSKILEEVTLLIQGKVQKEQLNLWIKNYSDWNVVVSTWNDFDIECELPNKWKLIKSDYPEKYVDMQNIHLQIASTLNGISNIDTKYVIKVRGDEFFTNLQNVYDKMKQIHPKVLVSSIFFRPLGLYPFHISDHIICTSKDNLKIMFEKTYEMLKNEARFNNSPESHFGFSFISAMENWTSYDVIAYLDVNNEMIKKWFDIYDVNELKPYIISQSSPEGRIYYRDNYGYNEYNIKEL